MINYGSAVRLEPMCDSVRVSKWLIASIDFIIFHWPWARARVHRRDTRRRFPCDYVPRCAWVMHACYKEAKGKRGEKKKKNVAWISLSRIIITRLWIGLAVTCDGTAYNCTLGTESHRCERESVSCMRPWHGNFVAQLTNLKSIHVSTSFAHFVSLHLSAGASHHRPLFNGSQDSVSLFQFSRDQSSVGDVSVSAVLCSGLQLLSMRF